MSTAFTITAKGRPDIFSDNVSMGDEVTYSIDFTPWQEANHTITSATWTVEAGNAAVSGDALTSSVATAQVTFSDAGRSLISVLAATATEKKKIWLDLRATDRNCGVVDYGALNG